MAVAEAALRHLSNDASHRWNLGRLRPRLVGPVTVLQRRLVGPNSASFDRLRTGFALFRRLFGSAALRPAFRTVLQPSLRHMCLASGGVHFDRTNGGGDVSEDQS